MAAGFEARSALTRVYDKLIELIRKLYAVCTRTDIDGAKVTAGNLVGLAPYMQAHELERTITRLKATAPAGVVLSRTSSSFS